MHIMHIRQQNLRHAQAGGPQQLMLRRSACRPTMVASQRQVAIATGNVGLGHPYTEEAIEVLVATLARESRQ